LLLDLIVASRNGGICEIEKESLRFRRNPE
jgi:hypothetical protein